MIRFKTQKRGFREMRQSLDRVGQFVRSPVQIMFERLARGLSGLDCRCVPKAIRPTARRAALAAQGGRLTCNPDTHGADVQGVDEDAGMATARPQEDAVQPRTLGLLLALSPVGNEDTAEAWYAARAARR